MTEDHVPTVRASSWPAHSLCQAMRCQSQVRHLIFIREGHLDSLFPGKISRVKPSQSHTEAGTVRKRAQRACRQCHAQKTKCSGELPRCKRCENADLKCEYTPAKRKFNFEPNAAPAEDAQAPPPPQPAPVPPSATATATPETAHSSASNPEPSKSPDPKEAMARQEANFPLVIDTSVLTAQELLTRKNFIIKHLDAYFENIYWLPCMGFFHPETAYREVYVRSLRKQGTHTS